VKKGFTLIEILVVIGVMSVLVAIMLPGLARSRATAREARCLSNLRMTSTVFELYSQRFRDRFPFATAGQSIDLSPDHEGTGGTLQIQSAWDLAAAWPGIMHEIAPWREWFASWVCSGARRVQGEPWTGEEPIGLAGATSYVYCWSFIARPENWVAGTLSSDALQRPVSVADVLYPSSKALMFDNELAHQTPRDDRDNRPILFVDGHSKVHRVSAASAPGLNVLSGSSIRLMDTVNGARGRDY